MDSFDSNGFTLGNDTSQSPNGLNTNASGYTYVCWAWKESATAGFDIVSYTGDGGTQNVSHSLSAVPHFFIAKNRDSADAWVCYHQNLTSGASLLLNTTDAQLTVSSRDYFNSTAPTSSVFTVKRDGSAYNDINESGEANIAYLFSEKQGFSKFGSYTGNGNADGTFIYLGFRCSYFMVKRTDTTNNWVIYDNKRSPINNVHAQMYADLSAAEGSAGSTVGLDFLSGGLKMRGSGNSYNASGGTYIYMAFAEAPFVNSKGVPCNAK